MFILGCHKSGTSLLRALLDSHSELNVIPIESHFFKNIGYWIDYPLKRGTMRQLSVNEKMQNLITYINSLNSVNEERLAYADSNTKGEWNVDVFKKSLFKNVKAEAADDKILFKCYAKAIFNSLGWDKVSDQNPFVEKSVENVEIASLIKAIFPNSVLIHILRNPYAVLTALRKKSSQTPFLLNSIYSIYKSFYHAYNNINAIKDYHVMRFEDLIFNTEESMFQVAKILGINFEPTLLRPTSGGNPWGGNSTSDINFSGISKKPLQKWKEEIKPFEIELVNATLGNVLSFYSYTQLEVQKRHVYSFLPKENIGRYIINRGMLYYINRIQNSKFFDKL